MSVLVGRLPLASLPPGIASVVSASVGYPDFQCNWCNGIEVKMQGVKVLMVAVVMFMSNQAYAQQVPTGQPVAFQVMRQEGRAIVELTAVGDAAFVPACRGVTWERFDTEERAFVPIAGPACAAGEAALRLEAEAVRFVAPELSFSGAVTVRPVVVVGVGCQEGLPLELAGCQRVVPVSGPTIALSGGE